MTTITVTDRHGDHQTLQVQPGTTLMEMLRDNTLQVDGTCGGAAYCGSCHVYLNQHWSAKLAEQDVIEIQTIEGLVHAKTTSRLACQIVITPALEGLAVTIAPSEI